MATAVFEAVIFDMDGVLVDSYNAHFESWKKLALLHNVEPMSPLNFRYLVKE